MEFKNLRRIAKILVMMIIGTILFNVALFLYAYNATVSLVESRLNDLTQIVATSNLLSKEDGTYDSFVSLLAQSETKFTRFSNPTLSGILGTSASWGAMNDPSTIDRSFFSVTDASGQTLYRYDHVVQRNRPITCTIKARVVCPLLFMSGVNIGSVNPIVVERSYTVIGQKFYKDLPA